jgi:2',3'-cyclic-nucleotide 2'-phosphodiesterase (5'-nucleotidase family)
MPKTFNFPFGRKLAVFSLALCLLVVCASGAAAQQSKAIEPCSATPSGSPAAKLKKAAAAAGNAADDRARVSETEINSTIPDDPLVGKMLGPYLARVRALDVVIGKLDGELKKVGMGGGSLGNFVADGMRAKASISLGQPVAFVVTNGGGLRKSAIAPGELRVRDIFELLPFENKLVELEMTGEQLLNVLKAVVASREVQSGARIKYRLGADQKPELISATLITVDGRETDINPTAIYRIITTDYLLSVSGGSLAILQQGKNTKPLGITIRDAVIDYVKAETAAGRTVKARLDGRFVLEGSGSPKTEGPPQ